MAAKHRQDTAETAATSRPFRRRLPALVAAAAVLGTTLTVGVAAVQADAAAPTRNVYLGGLGLFSDSCPVTPSNVVYAQPGSTVRLRPNTAGFGSLSVASLSTKVSNPPGSSGVNLSTSTANPPPAGSYLDVTAGSNGQTINFTWQFSLKTVYVLGIPLPIGDLLKRLGADPGVKLSYAGKIVVTSRAQTGCTLAPQLPGVQVSPSLPVVGQLPGVNVPGVQLPGVNVPSVGISVPGSSGSSTPTGGSTSGSGTPKPGSSGSASPSNPYGYNAPDCTGPCAVMPRGGGGGGTVGSAYGVTLGDLGDPAGASGGSNSGNGSGADAQAAVAAGGNGLAGGNAPLAADNAFDGSSAGSTTPPLPTTLAILAGAALVGATGLWVARRRSARA